MSTKPRTGFIALSSMLCSKIHTGPDKNQLGKIMHHSDSGRRFGKLVRTRDSENAPQVLSYWTRRASWTVRPTKFPKTRLTAPIAYLSAIWMLGSIAHHLQPMSASNTNAQRAICLVWVVLNILSEARRIRLWRYKRKMKYDEMRDGSKPQGALERISWCNASS